MIFRAGFRLLHFGALAVLLCVPTFAQDAQTLSDNKSAELQFVVILSRHGVRAPMHNSGQYDQYSAAPWPRWDVPPGLLTARGFELIKLFGAWDRANLSRQGLFSPSGCDDVAHVTMIANSDQRTRETGRALAEGMFPGCAIPVQARPEGTIDPLFRPLEAGVGHIDAALTSAAIAGRIGDDVNHMTEAYRSQLLALDRVLAGCGHAQPSSRKRTSILDVPASLALGGGDDAMARRGPLSTSMSITENFLLEYAQGMNSADVGWGCVDAGTIRDLMQLGEAYWNYGYRTPAIARMYASNLLDHIRKSMEQSVAGQPVPGALGRPGDRLLILVGHDTNIVTAAGALGINWIIDGRADDTPPGGALLFELWRSRADGQRFVRVEYTAQTLEQMRDAQPLTPANPPAQAPIFIPACSRQDLSCTWDGFSTALRNAIDPAYVIAQPK